MTPPTSLEAPASTANRRVVAFHDLPSPEEVMAKQPLTPNLVNEVEQSRLDVARVIAREDDRLLVVVGPCSIHDPEAAIDYARRLKATADELDEDLLVVMRVYFEKPRTTVGWKGLINDPDLDSSFKINKGLHMAREVLIEVLRTGLPAGAEFLEPNSPQYISDAVSWGAIGARTTESQVHRQLASGLSVPIGFKNGTDGNVQVAVDSLVSAANPHFFFGMNKAEQTVSIMVDASHANSGKSEVRQAEVVEELGKLIGGGDERITGIMMESFLEAGAQKITDGRKGLVYGKSVTDACMDWETTDRLLRTLAAEVRKRRQARD